MDVDNVIDVTSVSWDGVDRRGQTRYVYGHGMQQPQQPYPDPSQYQQPYPGYLPPQRAPGTFNVGVREVIAIVTAVGALIGVWVNLNQEITTLKLKVESEEKRVESLNGAIKDVGVSIEQVKIQMAKDKTDLEQTVRDLDNTVSQVYQRMTNTRK
jgi:hypothetical protein